MASFCSWVSRDSAGRAKGLGLGSFETLFIHMSRGCCCLSSGTLAGVVGWNILIWPLVWSGLPHKHGGQSSKEES